MYTKKQEMKHLIIIILLVFVSSCDPQGGQIISKIDDYDVKIIDSCEYLQYSRLVGTNTGVYSLTHKGNCKYCIERNKKCIQLKNGLN